MLTVFLFTLFAQTPAMAANSSGLSYHGRIVKPNGEALDSLNVRFRVQIRTPDVANCLLFEEESLLNLSGKDGVFSVSLNNGTNNRTDTTGLSIDRVFGNRGTITVTPSNCSYGNGVYTPTSSDGRNIQVSFRDETMTTWETLPVQPISFVPLAIEAKQVGGFSATSLLRVEDATGPQPAPPLSPANLTELFALVQGASGRYIPANPSGAIIPSRSTDPTGASAGQMWFDTSTNSFKYYDGNAVQSFANGGAQPPLASGKIWIGSATSAATAQTVSGDATLSTAGALTLKATGTAGTYIGVTTDAQGRVTSGTTTLTETQLPTIVTPGKVSGAAITTGTIGGNAAVNTTGNVTAANLSATSVSQQNLLIYEPTNTRKITLSAPAVTADYVLKLPAAAPGAGQFLVSDILGNLSWTATAGLSQWTTTGSDIYYNTGKVGIGTSAPGYPLVVTDATANPTLSVGPTAAANGNAVLYLQGKNSGVATIARVAADYDSNLNLQPAPSAATYIRNGAGITALTVDPSGQVGIGTNAPAAPLNIDNVQAGNTGTIAGTFSYQRVQPTAPSNALVRSGYYLANVSTTSNSPSFDGRGLEGAFFNGNTATVGSLVGTLGYVANTNSGGTITNARGISGSVSADTGTITNAYGGSFSTGGAGTITNGFGVIIGSVAGTASKWSLYTTDATAPSLFAGSVAIGTAAPTVSLDLSTRTDAVALPRGLDATRPAAPAMGMFRYSTASNALEFYNGTSWQTLSAGGAAGSLTNVSTISNSGGGISISASTGNSVIVTNGTTSLSPTSGALIVTGGVGISENLNVAQNLTTNGSISAVNATAATGAVNRDSPSIYLTANYWTGAASALDKFSVANLMGAGANPTATLTFDHPSGTSGNKAYAFINGNVGVGTTTPQAPLDTRGAAVAQNDNGFADFQTSTQDGLSIGYDSTNAWSWLYSRTVGSTARPIALFSTTSGANSPTMFLGTTGKVGIGTTSPTETLQINGGAGNGNISFTNATTGTTVGNGTNVGVDNTGAGQFSIWNFENTPILFATNGTEKARIAANGNVGIGTTAPNSPLDVSGQMRAGRQILNDSNSAFNISQIALGGSGLFLTSSAVTQGNISAGSRFVNGVGWYAAGGTSAASMDMSAGATTFYSNTGLTNGTTFTPTARMTIDTSGSVGIGTTVPGEKLQVAGNISASNYYSDLFGTAAAPTFAANGGGLYMPATNNVAISTASTERLRIDASGNVGIATNAPATALDLNGALSVRGMAAPAVSTAGQGRIYFDSSSNQFLVSSNTGAYTSLVTSGGGGGGQASSSSLTFNSDSDNSGADGGFNFQRNGMNLVTISNAGDTAVTSTTVSSGSSTGALRVAGGVGVTGALNVGGAINAAGGITATNGALASYSTNNTAYTATSASVAVPGGSLVQASNASVVDTTAASLLLRVNNSNPTPQAAYMSAVSTAGAGAYSPALVFGQQTGATAYAERMRIDATGNVGIGTINPGSLLTVSGGRANINILSGGIVDALQILNTHASLTQDFGVSLRFKQGAAVDTGDIASAWSNSADNANSYMRFQTRTAGALTEKLRIDANGKVGIGTISPTASLEVSSPAVASTKEVFAAFGPSDTGAQLYLANGTGNDARVAPMIVGNSMNTAYQGLTLSATAAAIQDAGTLPMMSFTASQYLTHPVTGTFSAISTRPLFQFSNNATPLMTTLANGNVGIGTAIPATKLQVAGSIMLGNGAETCGASYYGAIRFNTPNLELCNSSGWTVLSSSGGGGTYTGVSSISNTGGSITLAPETTAGAVLVTSTTASNGSNSGALVVSGGVGVTGNVNASGNIYSSNSVTSGGTMGTISAVAVSGTNRSSPGISLRGAYWDGAASQTDTWSLNNVLGTGTTPTSTLSFSHTGSPGTTQYSFMNGNVGVGTTAPSTQLHVSPTSSTSGADSALTLGLAAGVGSRGRTVVAEDTITIGEIERYNANETYPYFAIGHDVLNIMTSGDVASGQAGIAFGNGGAANPRLKGAGIGTPTDYTLGFYTGNSTTKWLERMRIDGLGNVGIGTASPTRNLAFTGNSAQTVGLERSTAGAGGDLTINAGGALAGATNTVGGNLILSSGIFTGNGGGGDMVFKTPINGASGTADQVPNTRMIISGNTGNVGIGAVPIPVPAPLTVFGNLRTVSNKSTIGDTIPGFQLSGLNSATNQTLYGTYEAGVESPTAGAENGFLSLKTIRSSVMTEAVRISAGGNVGIATTTPSSALSFGGDTSRVIAMERSSTATANPLTIAAGGTVPSASNGNGGTLILQSGIATGAGGSTIDFRTASPASSGTSDNSPSSKMTILGNGMVGIGTAASYSSNDKLALYSGGAYPVAISMKTLNSYPVTFTQDEGSTFTIINSNAARITIPATGNVGIGLSPNASYKLDVAGDANLSSGSALRIAGTSICTSAGCTATSDVRLKENILPLQASLEKVLQLNGVSYDWIDKKKFGSSKQIGLIAQELEKVYPEVVVTDSKTGFKSVAYDHLIAPIIESIKTLYDKITKADARILSLEEENKQLRAASETLRNDSEMMRKYLCQKDPNAAFCH